MGRDHTIYALTEGWVKFTYQKMQFKTRKFITVSATNPNIPPQTKGLSSSSEEWISENRKKQDNAGALEFL